VRLLAIDPGPVESAWVHYDTDTGYIEAWAKESNEEVLDTIDAGADRLAVEMIASYGMPVGAETFGTCVWIGRYVERWSGPGWTCSDYPPADLVFRREVKLHLCQSARAKDGNVRQALIDRYGPGKDLAIGKKATPGPLYGLAGDGWAALAVAVTVADGLESKAVAA
jgi:hypothetical protein